MADKKKKNLETQSPKEEPAVTPAEQPQPPDSVPETQANPETSVETPASPEQKELELLRTKTDSLNDKLLRTMAEYDNFRKRSQREKESIYPQATAAAVSQFVTILDTFGRAMEAPCTDPEFKKGVEMILQNFMEVLTKLGVEEFGAPGDLFDPELHNAVMHVEEEGTNQNTILEVFQKGYRMGERIIRHAMVKVVN